MIGDERGGCVDSWGEYNETYRKIIVSKTSTFFVGKSVHFSPFLQSTFTYCTISTIQNLHFVSCIHPDRECVRKKPGKYELQAYPTSSVFVILFHPFNSYTSLCLFGSCEVRSNIERCLCFLFLNKKRQEKRQEERTRYTLTKDKYIFER